ncbi:hypothetical protein NQZ68_014148 [Dissostichus eleginoides]|nr:hypothetical protein NQZ68_014148 [Dissostichus eleginoides]
MPRRQEKRVNEQTQSPGARMEIAGAKLNPKKRTNGQFNSRPIYVLIFILAGTDLFSV